MKRIISVMVSIFCFAVCSFAQSAEYSKYLSKAKEYESKKQWAFALEAYYNAIGCDDEPSAKIDALNGYLALSEAIKSGNPGLGKYNAFSVHDEWKKLLIDAEKLGSSICKFALRLGKLEQGDLDYKTHTASYKSKVQVEISDRYAKTVAVVEEGYKAAYKSDWNDLPKPENWPLYSVSSAKNAVYDVNGAKILEVPSRWKNNPSDYYNAFAVFSWDDSFYDFKKYPASGMHPASRSLYDYKFNIVDKNGNELVKGKRWLLSCKEKDEGKLSAVEIVLDGVPPAVMDLLDSGKAFINPVAVYLEYGKYNYDDDKGKRTFIKNFPETQLNLSKAMIYCWNKPQDLNAARFSEMFSKNITRPLIQSYFERISANGAIDESKLDASARPILFKIPLDEAYAYESGKGMVLNLTDDLGRTWKITNDDFLASVNEITNQEYSITNLGSPYYLERSLTDEEKKEFENNRKTAMDDAVKLYFEKISTKGKIVEYMGYDAFEIPMDSIHFDYTGFSLEDSSGKTWRITTAYFLTILKELTNQEYRISGRSLSRNLTEEEKNYREHAKTVVVQSSLVKNPSEAEKTEHENAKIETVQLYLKKISTNGKLDDNGGTLSFKIPLGEAYDGHGNFTLKDTSENELKVNEDDFLAILKNLTNQVYWIERNSLVRNATETEKSEFEAKRKAQRDSENEILIEKILAVQPSSYGMRGYAEYEYGSVSVRFNGSSYGTSSKVSDEIRMYAVLNKASEKLGYKPCYYQEQDGNRIYDPEKWNLGILEIKWDGSCKWDNATSIKEDRTAGGFYGDYYSNSDSMKIFRRK